VSRNDSGLALQSSLREKRSGQLSDISRRNSGIGHFAKLRDPFSAPETPRIVNNRRPSVGAFSGNAFGHHPSYSTSTLPNVSANYAPSVYAQSTLAASTIMQPATIVPVRDTEATHWVEGHCLQRQKNDIKGHCALCDERCDEDVFKCSGKSRYSPWPTSSRGSILRGFVFADILQAAPFSSTAAALIPSRSSVQSPSARTKSEQLSSAASPPSSTPTVGLWHLRRRMARKLA
jgi:hypothetical protein